MPKAATILEVKLACCEEQIDPSVDIKECTVNSCNAHFILENNLQQTCLEHIISVLLELAQIYKARLLSNKL